MRFLLHFLRLVPALAMVGVSGCVHYAQPNVDALKARGSLDLRCMEVAHWRIASKTWMVRGCGQEAIYVQMCQTVSTKYGFYEEGCVWMLNGGPRPISLTASNTPPARSTTSEPPGESETSPPASTR
jgi:hypothetical protein